MILSLATGVILLLVIVAVLSVVVFLTRRKTRIDQNHQDSSMVPGFNSGSVGKENSDHDAENGFILLREWIQLEEEIGQGCFGQVYRGRYQRPGSSSTSETVAVKVLKLTSGQREADRELIREAQTMAKFSHPNILVAKGIVINGDPLSLSTYTKIFQIRVVFF